MSARRCFALAALLVALYLGAQLAGMKRVGLTDDDDFYVPAGVSYWGWVARAARLEPGVFSQGAIDAAFNPNHEHPPLAKYVFGACHALFGRWLGPTDGARVGTVLFSSSIAAALLLLAVHLLGRRRGLYAGTVAVLLLLALPRFYFHSHAATLDVPVAATYLWAVVVALLSERRRWALLAAGPVFGLALATKLNAPFLLAGHLLFAWAIRRGRLRGVEGALLPPVPLVLPVMVVVGFATFVLSWPWLWFDTFGRIGAYVGFHLNHYPIYFLYFGTIYAKDPFAPWHAPLVMAATTVPLATSFLALTGLGLGARRLWMRLRFVAGPDDDGRREGELVLALVIHALVAVGTVAFSGGPKYGGEKLFMPFFPFCCLLAGYGALRLSERLGRSVAPGPGRLIPLLVLGLALLPSAALAWSFGEYALSGYNALAGGTRGATALGFERQYYDVAHRELVRHLNAEGPPGLKVHFLPNNWEYERTYKWYRQDGTLRPDIQVVSSEQQADWIVLTHERRFQRYGDDLARHRSKKVLKERLVDGAPIWSLLEARQR